MEKSRKIYQWIAIISAIVMVIAIGTIILLFVQYRSTSRQYEEILNDAYEVSDVVEEREQKTQETTPPSTEKDAQNISELESEPSTVYAEIPVNFERLSESIEDFIAWIHVEGTPIDYPVVYDSVQSYYYLHHSAKKTYSPSGAIFALNYNASDFSDFNTVLYGHNIKDGSMFASLHKFEKEAFFNDHEEIIVYTVDQVLKYRIYAACRTDDLDIILNNDFTDEAGRESFLNSLMEKKGLIRENMEVSPNDRLITLSTCTGKSETRFIVIGVLQSEMPGKYGKAQGSS